MNCSTMAVRRASRWACWWTAARELPIAADLVALKTELPREATLVLARQGEGAKATFAFTTESSAG